MYKVNVLYDCNCVITEKMETLANRPNRGDTRKCPYHKRGVTVVKVGEPWKDEKKIIEAK